MTPEDFNWEAPPLGPEDEMLINAYLSVGKSLDDLAYTIDFEVLAKQVEDNADLETLHVLYKRLLTLRKAGRLPRLSSGSSTTSSSSSTDGAE